MKNLRTKKLTKKETTTSMKTANVVIRPHQPINADEVPRAITVATVDVPKNMPNSTYQRNFPGRKTNHRFISQQKMFAKTKPTEVANVKRNARTPSVMPSAAENPKYLTMTSSAPRHLRQVVAKT